MNRNRLMQMALVFFIVGKCSLATVGEEAPVKFTALGEAVSFIAACLDSDDYNKLRSACLREKAFADAFSVLQYKHRKSPLTTLYSGREFPPKGVSFTLGGHDRELGRVHIDFVKRDGSWYIDAIRVCR
jgi:hypothetical protein